MNLTHSICTFGKSDVIGEVSLLNWTNLGEWACGEYSRADIRGTLRWGNDPADGVPPQPDGTYKCEIRFLWQGAASVDPNDPVPGWARIQRSMGVIVALDPSQPTAVIYLRPPAPPGSDNPLADLGRVLTIANANQRFRADQGLDIIQRNLVSRGEDVDYVQVFSGWCGLHHDMEDAMRDEDAEQIPDPEDRLDLESRKDVTGSSFPWSGHASWTVTRPSIELLSP